MATVLEECTTGEHCAFLWAKGFGAKGIHKEIFPVHSGKCFRVKRFTGGSRNVADDEVEPKMWK
jgi:hypothetical protein